MKHWFWWVLENWLGAAFLVLYLSFVAWYLVFRWEGTHHGRTGYHPGEPISCSRWHDC